MVDKWRKASPKDAFRFFHADLVVTDRHLLCVKRCPMGTVTRMYRFPHNFRHRCWYFQRMATMARPLAPVLCAWPSAVQPAGVGIGLWTWVAPCMALRIVSAGAGLFMLRVCLQYTRCHGKRHHRKFARLFRRAPLRFRLSLWRAPCPSLYDGKTDRGRENRLPKGAGKSAETSV